jgi:hypothetical protein
MASLRSTNMRLGLGTAVGRSRRAAAAAGLLLACYWTLGHCGGGVHDLVLIVLRPVVLDD